MPVYAPVALFVHARLEHTKQTVDALVKNELAERSELFVFSDHARPHVEGESDNVAAVRSFIRGVRGFQSVTLVERSCNFGLRRNIVDGVSDLLDRFDRIIVLEDDLVTHPDFLLYMNKCLDAYRDNSSVWHVAAWSPGVKAEEQLYFSRMMSCWGWGTWRDRWCHLELDAWRLMTKMSMHQRYLFNLRGTYPFFSHLVGNYLGKRSTWAILWSATINVNGGMCVNPAVSRVVNNGMDGSGTHDPIIFSQSNVAKCDAGMLDVKSVAAIEEVEYQLIEVYKKQLSLFGKASMISKMLFPLCLYRWIGRR